MEEFIGPVIGFIAGLLKNYPFFAIFIFIVGGLRIIFKPIFAVLRSYVQYTPNPADDVALDKVEASPIYKYVTFVLDYLASIKLGK